MKNSKLWKIMRCVCTLALVLAFTVAATGCAEMNKGCDASKCTKQCPKTCQKPCCAKACDKPCPAKAAQPAAPAPVATPAPAKPAGK